MNYNFRQATFDINFQKDLTVQITDLLDRGECINLISITGVGCSVYLKYLATRKFANFVYIDLEPLADTSENTVYNYILKNIGSSDTCKSRAEFQNSALNAIQKIEHNNQRIIIIFNHFYKLHSLFNPSFFDTFRSLRTLSQGKLIFIFQTHQPIIDFTPINKIGININLFSTIVCMPTFSEFDCQQITKILLSLDPQNPKIAKAIHLSGGHYLLLQLLAKSDLIDQPLADPYITLHLRELLSNLTYKQRRQINKIIQNQKIDIPDRVLMKTRFITEDQGNYQLFTPLLHEYSRKIISLKLSPIEKNIFSLFKKHLGKIIDKQTIFNEVWGDDQFPSDWALNSAIYRIRSNPSFQEQGYFIESHKKIGYRLVKN